MKKILGILIIFVVLFIISVIIINVLNKDDKIIVCIDAGHGGTDVGASLNDRYEKDDTLRVAKLVQENLKEDDIKVVMTRNEDKTVSLSDRCKIANKKKADLFVSIHRNSATSGSGIEIWVNSHKQEKDINLANLILERLDKERIQNNRGVKYGTAKGENTDYYVLNNTHMPSCLIELGFITDENDNKLLDQNIENYAKAIANGIKEGLNYEQAKDN